MNQSYDVFKDLTREALQFHSRLKKGKIGMSLNKPIDNQYDVSLAYTPWVAEVCKKIAADESLVFEYTNRSNVVGVITNGTAVLGLGNIGVNAAKPVMEGKAALFKALAGIDAIDICIDTPVPSKFLEVLKLISKSFGAVNLEDIKAPECFVIETGAHRELDIPIFHDDQHGTAIVVLAGLINALSTTGRDMTCKVVVNGAGAAAIATLDLMVEFGFTRDNMIVCDSKGVIREDRQDINSYKRRYAIDSYRTEKTLLDALAGCDIFIGLSTGNIIQEEHLRLMSDSPIIFAMSNPTPECLPSEVYRVHKDAIVATGRGDYPNQINNVLAFPYVLRAVLDTQSSLVTTNMKIAAAKSIANLAKSNSLIVPNALDPRLLAAVSEEVAKAAMADGVAKKNIEDFKEYGDYLRMMLRS